MESGLDWLSWNWEERRVESVGGPLVPPAPGRRGGEVEEGEGAVYSATRRALSVGVGGEMIPAARFTRVVREAVRAVQMPWDALPAPPPAAI